MRSSSVVWGACDAGVSKGKYEPLVMCEYLVQKPDPKFKVDKDDGKRRRENEARKVKREKWKKQMRRRWHGTYRKLRVAKCTWARADDGERKWQ